MTMVSVPYRVEWGKKKKTRFYLNLNNYRNAHFHVLNKAKEVFYELVCPLLQNLPDCRQVRLTYTLYPRTMALCDTANICSIVDKFFCDTLVGAGKIPDDNYQIVKSVAFHFGNVDKDNPRVDVLIEPMGADTHCSVTDDHVDQQKEDDMQITLVQTEIEAAIRQYVTNQVSVNDGKRIDITLRATRGAEGYQAIVDIVNNDSPNGSESTTSTASTSGPQAEPEVQASTVNAEDRQEPNASEKKGSLFSAAKEPVNA